MFYGAFELTESTIEWAAIAGGLVMWSRVNVHHRIQSKLKGVKISTISGDPFRFRYYYDYMGRVTGMCMFERRECHLGELCAGMRRVAMRYDAVPYRRL